MTVGQGGADPATRPREQPYPGRVEELPPDSARRALRASDHDRQAVLRRLQRAAGEGRLTLEEVDERTAAALRARTRGELADLTGDLPPDLW